MTHRHSLLDNERSAAYKSLMDPLFLVVALAVLYVTALLVKVNLPIGK